MIRASTQSHKAEIQTLARMHSCVPFWRLWEESAQKLFQVASRNQSHVVVGLNILCTESLSGSEPFARESLVPKGSLASVRFSENNHPILRSINWDLNYIYKMPSPRSAFVW